MALDQIDELVNSQLVDRLTHYGHPDGRQPRGIVLFAASAMSNGLGSAFLVQIGGRGLVCRRLDYSAP
jgi:hypothetical protein